MPYSRVYMNQALHFLRSMTVKCSFMAKHYEQLAMDITGDDYILPEENPYYLNLYGCYSILDRPMYITSADTGENILFSKENLELHPKTKHLYSIRNEFVKTLEKRYPKQDGLIRGIIYPVDSIKSAIDANDFELLNYDRYILEDAEADSIIEAVTNFLVYFRKRWYIKEYEYEELYPVGATSLLYTSLLSVILDQRIQNIKTHKAHSYHIWQYLESNGLGNYKDILSRKQQLFLYKNLGWILKNRGKEKTLKVLDENLLRSHNVILTSKSVIVNGLGAEDNVTPIAEVISSRLDDNTTIAQDIYDHHTETFQHLYSKEYQSGLLPDYDGAEMGDELKRFSIANQTWLPTKYIEFKRDDVYLDVTERYTRHVANTLYYLFYRDRLKMAISFIPDITGSLITLDAGEALALLNYCICNESNRNLTVTNENVDGLVGKTINYNLEDIIVTEANKANYIGKTVTIRYPHYIPTEVSVGYVYKADRTIPETFKWDGIDMKLNSIIDVDKVLSRIPEEENVSSAEDLLKYLDSSFNAKNIDHLTLEHNASSCYHRAFDILYDAITESKTLEIDLVPKYDTYEDWFATNEKLNRMVELLNNSTNFRDEFLKVGEQIIDKLCMMTESRYSIKTGFASNSFKLMRHLFEQLCSYNVAFLDPDIDKYTYVKTPTTTVGISTEGGSASSNESLIEVSEIGPDIELVQSYKLDTRVNEDLPIVKSIAIDGGGIDVGSVDQATEEIKIVHSVDIFVGTDVTITNV